MKRWERWWDAIFPVLLLACILALLAEYCVWAILMINALERMP
jgi:hypothetical protein